MAATKIPYRTKYNHGDERYYLPTGDGYQDEYGYEINEKGQKQLVWTGRKNLYKEIQSYADDCNIENILKRAANGDLSDFRPDGIYADVTKVPTNMIEAQKEMMKLEHFWNNMSKKIKAKYNNSLETFISKAGEESWLIDTGLIQPKDPEPEINIQTTAPDTTPEVPDVK